MESIHILHRICGEKPPQPAFNTDEFAFNYDFNSVEDDGGRYMRGGFQYKRPYGWRRIAIKVLEKCGDALAWPRRDTNRRSRGAMARVLSRNKYEGYPADFKKGLYINPDQKRYTLFLYKNIFYKNIEAEICEILRIF